MRAKIGLDVITLSNPESIASEQYRSIRSNIQIQREKKNIQSLMITSANPGEGKTTTSINLAVSFALMKFKTLLIDGDLRKRSISETLHVKNTTGLCGILEKDYSLEFSTYSTNVEYLDFLPSGTYQENPAEIFSKEGFAVFLKEASTEYDLIIVDVPPVAEVADAQIISTKIDSTILVVRDNKSSKKSVKEAKKTLDGAGADILGIVYNGHKLRGSRYYGRGGEGYGYGQGKSKKKSLANLWKQ